MQDISKYNEVIFLILLIGITLVLRPKLINFCTKNFPCKWRVPIKNTINILVIFFIIGAVIIGTFSYTESYERIEVAKAEARKEESRNEVLVAVGTIAIDQVEKGVKKIRENKQAKRDNKEKRFVIQIGEQLNNKKAVAALYSRIQSSGYDVANLVVLKISRKSFILFENEKTSPEEIPQDVLDGKRLLLNSVEPVVRSTDINSFCSLSQKLVETKQLKFRRQKIELRQFECGR